MSSPKWDSHRQSHGFPWLIALVLFLTLATLALLGANSETKVSAQSGVPLVDPSGTYTVYFQKSDQYGGVYDSYLSKWLSSDETTNFGSSPEMYLRRSGAMRPMIKFDVSTIPPGATITHADLKLYCNYRIYGSDTYNLATRIYQLNRPWDELEVTWRQAKDSFPWAVAGADAIPVDRSDTAVTIKDLKPADRNTTVAFDVTSAVQSWVDNPSGNQGLILIAVDERNTGYTFETSDSNLAYRRPRLEVTYEGAAPLHTATPTATPTYTPTPENLNVINSSVALQGDMDCIGVGPGAESWPAETDVFIYWQGGTPWSAKLIMDLANVNSPHSIYVNDQLVGTAQPAGGSMCQAGMTKEWNIDPTIVREGWNTVRLAMDANTYDGWTAKNIKIQIVGTIVAPEWQDVKYGDRAPYELMAKVQVPLGYSPDTPVPLLVSLHGWGSPVVAAGDAMYVYSMGANERGWLLGAPQILGQHSASLDIQMDIVRFISYMKTHYAVDSNRIYLVGKSMGAGIASVVAAKYPDLFAAVVEERGPTDLADWYRYSQSKGLYYYSVLYSEMGMKSPDDNPFEYERRSARQMAQNLKHVPIAITHGTSDTIVPVDQGRLFATALRSAGVDEVEYHEYSGTHDDDFPGDATMAPWPEGILDFLGRHVRPSQPPHDIHIRNDQQFKSYYWLSIEQIRENKPLVAHWTDVDARYDTNSGTIWADVYDQVNVWGTSLQPHQVRLTFDLNAMGLDRNSTFVIETYQEESGEFKRDTVLGPQSNGQISVLLTSGDDPKHFHVVISSGPLPESYTKTFQQGVQDYAGTADSYIKSWDPTGNYGNEQLIIINGSNQVGLLRFDLGDLGSTPITIQSALLYLTTAWGSGEVNLNLYQMLRGWNEGQANWINAASGVPWGLPGAADTTTDHLGMAVDARTVNAANTTYSFNVRRVVEYWIAHPSENFGLLLKEDGAISYQLASSESNTAGSRPRLEVRYVLGTPTPTATASGTPTRTPSRTSTPTMTPTGTLTPVETPTATFTWTPRHTPTSTLTPTATATPTFTATPSIGPYSITGKAFDDMNLNAIPDPWEPSWSGVAIKLISNNQELARTVTDANGTYRFNHLYGGQYFVIATLPDGFIATGALGAVGSIPPDLVGNFRMRPAYTATPTSTMTRTATATPTESLTASPTSTSTPTKTPSVTATGGPTGTHTPTGTPRPTPSSWTYLPAILK